MFRNLTAGQQLRLAFLFPLLLSVVFFILEFTGTFYLKQLWAEGSMMAYEIFQTQKPYIPNHYFRYTTAIWQLPAYISSLLTNNILISSWLFSLGYMIFPFIGLGISVYVCLKKQRLELLFLILIQFFLVIAPNTLFAVGIVNEAVVVFWMMSLLILISTKPSPVGIFILSLWLAFNYEIAFLLNASAIYLLWREKKLTKVSGGILSGAILLQLYLLMGIVVPGSKHVRFIDSLEWAFDNSFVFLIIAAFVVVMISTFRHRLNKWLLVSCLLVCSWFCIGYFDKMVDAYWIVSYHMRIWVIPAAAAIFIIGYEVFRKTGGKLLPLQVIAVSILFVPITMVEFSVLRDQAIFYNRLTSEISNHSGCYPLSEDRYQFVTNQRDIPKWTVHVYSIFIQNSVNPRTVLFVPQTYGPQEDSNKLCVIKRYVNPKIHFPIDGRIKYPITKSY